MDVDFARASLADGESSFTRPFDRTPMCIQTPIPCRSPFCHGMPPPCGAWSARNLR